MSITTNGHDTRADRAVWEMGFAAGYMAPDGYNPVPSGMPKAWVSGYNAGRAARFSDRPTSATQVAKEMGEPTYPTSRREYE
jgi:hypothetical protein